MNEVGLARQNHAFWHMERKKTKHMHMLNVAHAGRFSLFRSEQSGGMPIRRAPATPTQEKAPSAAAEKGEAGVVHPSTPPDRADPHPPFTETCVAPSGGRMKDGFKYKKSKSKKVKRTIPAWASVTANKNIPVTNFAGRQNQVENVLVEAIGSSNERSGMSFQSVMKYMLKKYPGMELNKKRFLIKKAMKKHLEKGTIKQVKVGLNFSESEEAFFFYSPRSGAQKHESLGDALPLIITRLCEPKEASYNLIKKYLEQHFPSLNIENRPDLLKTALVKAVEKGHLEQITGKGARGTFQLSSLKNDVLFTTLEDAITVAITAMNEPKTCSTTSLRKFLWELSSSVANLRRTLTKCKVLGWMEQITGHGFTGTYQLSFPFYPSATGGSPACRCTDAIIHTKRSHDQIL
uniref:Heterochromatin protein 1-binding protein 3 n=1 Tax=Fundulus heteroclitus TaxID=8078 RepID=A0A3Q2PEL1_FUNHE